MKNLSVILLCVIACGAFAQEKKTDFKKGDEFELLKLSGDLGTFGNDSDGIVNLSLKKDELFVTRFDPKTLAITNKLQVNLGDERDNYGEVISFDNRFYWLRNHWDKKRKREILYVNQVDVKSGKIDPNRSVLLESNRLRQDAPERGGYRIREFGKYNYIYNADRTRLLIIYRVVPDKLKDEKGLEKVGVFVFNNKMEKIWGEEFVMPCSWAVIDYKDFVLDKDGNVYLLTKIYGSVFKRERDKTTNLPDYHLELFKFTSTGGQSQKKIPIGDFFVKQSTLVESSGGDMVIVSLYSDYAGNGTGGFLLNVIGADGNIRDYKKGKYKLPIDELRKFASPSRLKNMEKDGENYEPGDLELRDVLVEKDGSIMIALEEYVEIHPTMEKNSHDYITFLYNEMLALRIDSTGELQWVRKIPKYQRGIIWGRGTMSFKLISDGLNYYFVYLDNLKNFALKEDQEPSAHVDGQGGQLVVVNIDKIGNVSKEIIFDSRSENVRIYPTQFRGINNNQFILRAEINIMRFCPILITLN